MNILKDIEINSNIHTIRGVQVMLDSDIARLYDVETKRINEAVRNNPDKFPPDFYFQVTNNEFEILRSKISTTKFTKTRTLPKVFTEQGVYLLATVLKSKVATNVTINIMRTFTKLREFAYTYQNLIDRLDNIEQTIKIDQQQTNYNTERIDEAFTILKEILHDTKQTDKTLIGFRPNLKKGKQT